MKKAMALVGFVVLACVTALAQPAADTVDTEAPKRIILEEKQLGATAAPLELKLPTGPQIRVSNASKASMTKYEMSNAKGNVLEALSLMKARLKCSARRTAR